MSPQWLSVIVAALALVIAILTYRNTRAASVEASVEKAIKNIVDGVIKDHKLDKQAHNGYYVSWQKCSEIREKCDQHRERTHREAQHEG